MGDSPMKITSTFFSSFPYLLVARHVKFPSSFTCMLAMFEVAFTRVVEFFITAMCMGRVPAAEHTETVRPSTARTTAAGDNTFGETKIKIKRFNSLATLH